jgi:hypothetical protein
MATANFDGDLTLQLAADALDSAVRMALARAIRNCRDKSREQIASALSEQTGTRITLRTLNALTAESRRPYRFPATWVIPFCRITGDDSLQRLLLGPTLGKLLSIGEIELAAHHAKMAAINGASGQSSAQAERRMA